MVLDQTLLNLSGDTQNINRVKTIILEQLRDDEIISDEEFQLYENQWQMILVQKGWFKKLIDPDKSKWFYKYVNFSFTD